MNLQKPLNCLLMEGVGCIIEPAERRDVKELYYDFGIDIFTGAR
jgi:hypothetical protein